jgi:hypothetical protein
MLISWSKRPALLSAASRESGRLVAPITMMALFSVFSQESSAMEDCKLIVQESTGWKHTIHTGQELGHDAALHLSLCTLALWCDRVNFIDEEQTGCHALLRSMGCKRKTSGQSLTLASSNVSLRVFSDSPDMPDTIDGADILMKGTPSS